MSGRTHGAGPSPQGDAQDWAPQHEAAGDIDPQAPLSLCPTLPGTEQGAHVRGVFFFQNVVNLLD